MLRPKLVLPHVYVKMHDGTEHSWPASTVDTVAYERLHLEHPKQFGDPQETPMTWGQFLAWHVCVKSRRVLPADLTLKQFAETAEIAIAFMPEDENGDDVAVDPTRPDPMDG